MAVLDPDVVLPRSTAPDRVRRRSTARPSVAATVLARGRASRRSRAPAIVNGRRRRVVGAADGAPNVVVGFTIVDGRIRSIDLVGVIT